MSSSSWLGQITRSAGRSFSFYLDSPEAVAFENGTETERSGTLFGSCIRLSEVVRRSLFGTHSLTRAALPPRRLRAGFPAHGALRGRAAVSPQPAASRGG